MEDTVRASAREGWSNGRNRPVPFGAMESSDLGNCLLAWQEDGGRSAEVGDEERELPSQPAGLLTRVGPTGAAHLTHHRVAGESRLNGRWRAAFRR